VDRAGLRPDDRVLDAGCGAGAALKPAAAVAGAVVGIDISPGMVERAREAVPKAQVLVGDAGALPFDDASFDVVLSAFTVFFFDEPTDALREWRRVLKPDGRIAMTTWGDADPRWAWEREVRKRFIGDIPPERLGAIGEGFQRLTRFDAAGKVDVELRAAGFAPQSVEPHAIEFRFVDEQAWWEWNWSHGTRGLLEALSEDNRTRYREQAFEAMQPLRDADGGFPRTYAALVAIAG
jgi:SAM-dependent methyltransferase